MDWIDQELKAIQAAGRERRLDPRAATGGKFAIDGSSWLNFSSNDYLDLARHPKVIAVARDALETYGAGATSSRLVAGTLELHERLEAELASHKGYPAALVFGSGFLTNLGVISALVGRNDHIFADRLIHASMVDAAGLSRAKLHRFHHNDMDHLASLLPSHPSGKSIILAESVYSMDGDLAPLPDLARLAREHDALLMIDEAHSAGIFGPEGSGLIREHELTDAVQLSMGTLSKAWGGYGGYVACSAKMRALLINKARSFIYTTGLPPASAGAALGALEVLRLQPELGPALLDRADYLREKLQAAGMNTGPSASQIIPVIIGDIEATMEAARVLRERHILAVPIRPPTVPEGSARLRLSVTLAHQQGDLDYLVESLKTILL